MGKYIKKSKGTGEVAVMEVSAQGGCLGVKTRARTLALQRDAASSLQKAASYLQLRSRRLEKPPFLSSSARPAEQAKPLASDHAKRATHLQERRSPPVCVKETDGLTSAVNSARSGSVTVSLSCSSVRPSGDEAGDATGPGASAEKPVSESETAVEASFGENILEGDGRESCRSVRETTPCSLMRNSENLEAPGSTTRPTNPSETNRRTRSETHRSIPTADEMEEFFAAAERQQLRSFSEKYNYDPVKDLPLPGRYEWIRLTP
ncbi:cyclin-dependent kinase inhibitor 5-like [Nymphaea colorata]|nr:cyclin-dependent kinase inhibitor 5-like [Nymphaea colorata]